MFSKKIIVLCLFLIVGGLICAGTASAGNPFIIQKNENGSIVSMIPNPDPEIINWNEDRNHPLNDNSLVISDYNNQSHHLDGYNEDFKIFPINKKTNDNSLVISDYNNQSHHLDGYKDEDDFEIFHINKKNS